MLTPLDLPSGDEPASNPPAWRGAQLRSRDWWVPVPAGRAAEFEPIARATRGHVREHDARRLDLGSGTGC